MKKATKGSDRSAGSGVADNVMLFGIDFLCVEVRDLCASPRFIPHRAGKEIRQFDL
jgi:hypothetical protein